MEHVYNHPRYVIHFHSHILKKYINFKFFTRAIFHKTKRTHDVQTGSVNSTYQLKWPFNRFSSCHTNPFEHHNQQKEQLTTVMSNDNLFIFLELKFEQDSQSTARDMSDFRVPAQQMAARAYCLPAEFLKYLPNLDL